MSLININILSLISQQLAEVKIESNNKILLQACANKTEIEIFKKLMNYLDGVEHLIYSKFDYNLLNYKEEKLKKYMQALKTLNDYHIELCYAAVHKNFFWVREELADYKGKTFTFSDIKYFFYEFYNKLLSLSVFNTIPAKHIHYPKAVTSMLFKIASRPLGQKLLINLAMLLKQGWGKKINLVFGAPTWAMIALSFKEVIYNKTMPLEKHEIGHMIQPYTGRSAAIKMYISGGTSYYDGSKSLELHIPQAYGDELSDSYSAKLFSNGGAPVYSFRPSIIYCPSFLSLAHELIHCMHYFRNKARTPHEFGTRTITVQDITYLTKRLFTNPEELWTISEGKINENLISEEHNLLVLKSTHLSYEN